jgi:hypothetical protein
VSTAQAKFRNLARTNSQLKRFLVAINDAFIDHSVPLSYKIMRGVCRSNVLRRTVLALRREPLALGQPKSDLIHGCDQAKIGATLQRDGLALGLWIDDSIRDSIRSYCAEAPAVTDKGEQVMVPDDLAAAPIPDRFLYRYPNLHKQVSSVANLANDPLLLAVVGEYVGRRPVLLGSRAWYSYPPPRSATAGGQHEYGFHYDIDDYKFIKLFVYLSDVDEASGPHVAISGTHRVKSMFEKMNRRISDEAAAQRYGDRVTVITGKAGTAFFEDTFCYHKGTSPQKRRFILEIEYGITKFSHCNA